MRKQTLLGLIGLMGLWITLSALADEIKAPRDKPFEPKISPASKEGEQAIQRFRIPAGMKVDVFAAEPMLANPVAFCVDEQNRFYVAETFRHHQGVTDIRGHTDWLDDDLAARTVEDRVALLKKHLGKEFATYEVAHDQVRRIVDKDNDGKADVATVFADGFNNAPDGIGAGVLARRGDVYYTCLPDVWLLRDRNADGKADVRKSLQYGYGVHVGYLGHDLHGLKLGPDGKLYFSIGDRGLHVKTPSGVVSSPDTGAVLRCNLDGSDLEIFASGLRNPQELAFDNYGNLFTGDNNSDGGDKARWVHLVEGGDSGWRIGYQFLNEPVARGPWNAERMWHPEWDGQAAFLLPPIANLGDGPSGLVHYPGVGLSKRYDEHFFLCDFRGGPANSGIRSFAVKPKGATFELTDSHEFLWQCLPTDVDFGMDGAMYFTDWINGWRVPTKGRIYRVRDPEALKNPAVREVRDLMAKGIHTLPTAKLIELLKHVDQRVRLEAQFSLADKGEPVIASLATVAAKGDHQLARLHAIWALGQIGRKQPKAAEQLLPLLKDDDAEVRAQAAKVLGECKQAKAYALLVALLSDDSARPRFFAAMSLGRLGRKEAVTPILAMLQENADQDKTVRHAGVMALTMLADAKALSAASEHESRAVRMAALLAMRRIKSAEIARFLHDPEPSLIAETARAIYDELIVDAMTELAALLDGSTKSEAVLQRILSLQKEADGARIWVEPILYRALNANLRLGKPAHAKAVAELATRGNVPVRLRIEAMRLLRDWSKPSGRDHIVGLWRPLGERDAAVAAEGLRTSLGAVLTGPDQLRSEAIQTAAKLGIKDVGPTLLKLLKDNKRPAEVRVESLRALNQMKDERLKEAVDAAIKDREPTLRHEARVALARLQPEETVETLREILEKGDSLPGSPTPEQRQRSDQVARQGAFEILATLKSKQATDLLGTWVDRLAAGKVAPALQLDVVNAAGASEAAALKAKLARYESAKPMNDPLAKYRESLVGGDAGRGRAIFLYKNAVSCMRCHKVDDLGGDVGPNLSDVGLKQKRDYLLESIVHPNAKVAKGFETIEIFTKKGKLRSGIVKEQTKEFVRLMTPEGKLITVQQEDIEERKPGKSAMPEDAITHLTRFELRDLVEFLASLKRAPKNK